MVFEQTLNCMEFKWNCQNFGLIYRKAYFDYNRFQEATVFIEIKKWAGDSELKASRISFRINRENRVLFGPARFLCAQFAFQPPLAPTFQLVHVSTGTVVRARVFRWNRKEPTQYKDRRRVMKSWRVNMRLSGKDVQSENRRRLELQAEYKLSTLLKPAPTDVAHFLVHFFAVTTRLQF